MEVTPRLDTIVKHKLGQFRFSIFPDMGGCATMISHDLITKHLIPLEKKYKIPSFQAINGMKITISGTKFGGNPFASLGEKRGQTNKQTNFSRILVWWCSNDDDETEIHFDLF